MCCGSGGYRQQARQRPAAPQQRLSSTLVYEFLPAAGGVIEFPGTAEGLAEAKAVAAAEPGILRQRTVRA